MNLRPILFLLSVAACGGPQSSSSPKSGAEEGASAGPASAEQDGDATHSGSDEVNVYGSADMANDSGASGGLVGPEYKASAPPAPPQPPPLPRVPIYDRLGDSPGDVPGLAGFSTSHAPDATRCGGIKITTKRSKKFAAKDKLIVEVFSLEFPTGLNFDPDQPAVTKASTNKFKSWLGSMQSVSGRAAVHYQDQLKNPDATVKAVAAARLVQFKLRLASTFARAPIPKDLTQGVYAQDKMNAYCDALADQAEGLLKAGESDAKSCTSIAAAAGPGWWTTLCHE